MKKKKTNLSKVRVLLNNVLMRFEQEIEQILKLDNINDKNYSALARNNLIKKNEELLSVLTKIFNLEIKIQKAEYDLEELMDASKEFKVEQEISEDDVKILSNYLREIKNKDLK